MFGIDFFPVARGSCLLPLLGLTSESCIKYHIWLGHMAMTIFTSHGICFIIKWAAINQLSECSKLKVFFIFHVVIPYACIMLPGFYLFLVDRYLRFLQSRRQVRLVSARVLPCEVVELNFSKGHGITLVMVSGGSGITPFISIIRELIYVNTTFKCKTPKVVLICAFKNSSSLSMLDLILPISGIPSDISNMELQIEVYITRDKELKADGPIPKTIWFKSNPSDEPVHAILGPNSWLWLGAIISSSFIFFLILIGIITRYYIFPIDHNTNKIFPFPFSAFLNMLVICLSIASVASAAFLWSKKHNAKQAKQIQNLEGSTPTASPNSMVYNAERELESLPCHTLIHTINVHFGVRPDLRKMLLEHKGPRVGVLASGPKIMRQEVAAICSFGLAENLHFESISFSW
ncbi:hypothetical protein VNO78_25217 [Psophocarpus tetragonolobus]|uniref:Uncharacterized protein n=1 Tax=Psophocarpus tetragonolobus TaxID=3891 RepID=A0AAN9S5K3_PSOTE